MWSEGEINFLIPSLERTACLYSLMYYKTTSLRRCGLPHHKIYCMIVLPSTEDIGPFGAQTSSVYPAMHPIPSHRYPVRYPSKRPNPRVQAS